MKGKTVCLMGVFILSFFAMLSGCQNTYNAQQDVLTAKSGFLCKAINKKTHKTVAQAWATRKYTARDYALSRCQSHIKSRDNCEISECIWTGSTTLVAPNRWFTCYVMNQKKLGVWSATSHNRIRATTWAYNRCLRYSGKPNQCYFSYCRIW